MTGCIIAELGINGYSHHEGNLQLNHQNWGKVMIIQENWNGDLVVLKTITRPSGRGKIVEIGDILVSNKEGERYRIVGARAPHKPESTGRISVKSLYRYDPDERDWTHEYFPGVLDLEWVPFENKNKKIIEVEQSVHDFIKSTLKAKGK